MTRLLWFMVPTALAVGTMTNWVANWLVTVSFPSLRDWNLPATYFMYAAFALISLVFVLRYLKETNGRSLEEMGS